MITGSSDRVFHAATDLRTLGADAMPVKSDWLPRMAKSFEDLILSTQQAILATEADEDYQSAHLGDALRTVHYRQLEAFQAKRDALIEPIKDRLERVIRGSR